MRATLKNHSILRVGILFFLLIADFSLGQSRQYKIDPVLRDAVLSRSSVFLNRKTESKTGIVDVFIRTTDLKALRQKGIEVRTKIGDIVTASIPLSRIEYLVSDPSILYIHASSVYHPMLNVSVPEIGADHVRNGDYGIPYTGQGVIVGIYDSGIDWDHPDFISPGGQSRILAIWDQTDDSGLPPEGQIYGTEYKFEDINNEINGLTQGIVREKDRSGHGTHIAGIAASNGQATGSYIGVAPEADLLIVKGGDEEFIDTQIEDGLKYIFNKADEIGCPAVVNLSLGSQKGPHDGTTDLEYAIDSLLVKNGRAVVAAAGNDGTEAIHASGILSSSGSMDVDFNVEDNPSAAGDELLFDAWYPDTVDLSISVVQPDNQEIGPVGPGSLIRWPNPENPMIVVENTGGEEESLNNSRQIYIRISDVEKEDGEIDNFLTGTWKFRFSGTSGKFDIWLYKKSVSASFTSQVDFSTLVNSPGNAYTVITVGSYISRNTWPCMPPGSYKTIDLMIGNISSDSSPGPTRTDYRKPEISAPGEYILSSLSTDMTNPPVIEFTASDNQHYAMEGTSMSAPHVAGVVALMFQANSELTSSEIKTKLIQTARKDESTGQSYWNKYSGYGKIDALEVMKITSVKDRLNEKYPKSYLLFQNYPNPFNETTLIEYILPQKSNAIRQPVRLEIIDLAGRQIFLSTEEKQEPGKHYIIWNGRNQSGKLVASGIYLCRLMVGREMVSKKMIYLK